MIKEAFGTGETINIAQDMAKKELGDEYQDVKFEVIQMPTKKTLGLFGGKPAKVRAFIEISPGEVAANYVEDVLKEFGLKDFEIEVKEDTTLKALGLV